ncbi:MULTISPECIES: hypothetical protein [Paenibacillus]|uniref:hypothetical protein n=1 Tax=Paenibacillus TaxID=44249 RepID=UPI00096F9D6C|nr:hypothetical protein [Paenibacillus odorifer]OME07568.1 hypothetical protein BSK60_30970 [Paenibacillus odorifer]
MTPEQLLEVFTQYHELTEPNGWTLFSQNLTTFAPLITLVSIIIVFVNVNRTQKKNMENDIEKFKRDLGLKSADEMIEAITSVKVSYYDIVGLKQVWNIFLDGKTDLGSIKAHIEKCMGQYETTSMIAIQYRKREIVLSEFDQQIEFVYEMGTQMSIDLTEVLGYLTDKPGHTDLHITKVIDRIDENAMKMTLHLNNLLKDIQNKFLSKIYGEELN